MYEGFTNYQTWALMNWIQNETGTNGFFQDITYRVYETYPIPEEGIKVLADTIKDIIEDDTPSLEDDNYDGMFTKILTKALEEVDYEQIADMMLNYEEE